MTTAFLRARRRTQDPPPVEALALQIRGLRLPEPVRELRFARPRRFRFDLAWPEHGVALEVDGGVFTGGRHVRGVGYERDAEKMSLAAIRGWRVLRVTPRHVRKGLAIEWVRQALEGEP